MIPPLVMWLKIQWFGVWIPLFLIWPIVILLLLLVLPFVFIGLAVAGRISQFWKVLRVIFAAYLMICAVRGLRIDIHKEHRTFEIYLP